MNNKPETSNLNPLLATSLQEHLKTIQQLVDETLPDIQISAELLWQVLSSERKVLLCGNGGSAADAQHIAAELVGRYESHRRALPAIALTTDTSALTALSNDYGYAEVFARQVEALASAGDLLVAISTSGKSENVLRAVAAARTIGCRTLALAGGDGDPLASTCEHAVVVPSHRTARVQEAHITIGHLWCEVIDQKLKEVE
ncbi:MAG TPA: D-sedoheptulose 7-phosphate isomerase [Pyrinomonadaceae bacterium]|nr:D-sedoheptulose 7-phosphate isomerase [Pyrinomonadaceae bacterium]